jgi:hypothetical protein
MSFNRRTPVRAAACVSVALAFALLSSVGVSTEAPRTRPTVIVNGREAVAGEVIVWLKDTTGHTSDDPEAEQISRFAIR